LRRSEDEAVTGFLGDAGTQRWEFGGDNGGVFLCRDPGGGIVVEHARFATGGGGDIGFRKPRGTFAAGGVGGGGGGEVAGFASVGGGVIAFFRAVGVANIAPAFGAYGVVALMVSGDRRRARAGWE